MWDQLVGMFGESATGSGTLRYGVHINDEHIEGAAGTDGQIYQYTDLANTLYGFVNALVQANATIAGTPNLPVVENPPIVQPNQNPLLREDPNLAVSGTAADYIFSYGNLPPQFNWQPAIAPGTGDTVYYAQIGPNEQLYVGPDNQFYDLKHLGPITPSDVPGAAVDINTFLVNWQEGGAGVTPTPVYISNSGQSDVPVTASLTYDPANGLVTQYTNQATGAQLQLTKSADGLLLFYRDPSTGTSYAIDPATDAPSVPIDPTTFQPLVGPSVVSISPPTTGTLPPPRSGTGGTRATNGTGSTPTFTYSNRPPQFYWQPEIAPGTGDTVYYAQIGPDEQLYVGPDSQYYDLQHLGPIAPSDVPSAAIDISTFLASWQPTAASSGTNGSTDSGSGSGGQVGLDNA